MFTIDLRSGPSAQRLQGRGFRKGEPSLESRDQSRPKTQGHAAAREQAARFLVAERFPSRRSSSTRKAAVGDRCTKSPAQKALSTTWPARVECISNYHIVIPLKSAGPRVPPSRRSDAPQHWTDARCAQHHSRSGARRLPGTSACPCPRGRRPRRRSPSAAASAASAGAGARMRPAALFERPALHTTQRRCPDQHAR